MIGEWIEYDAEESTDYITVDRWGKDHWSLLAYIETREVDHKGILDGDHMRCNQRLHREMVGRVSVARGHDGSEKYPTRTKDGDVPNHDDWSCLEDIVAAGLAQAWLQEKYHNVIIGSHIAKIKLTDAGRELAEQVRRHKANGGNYGNFEMMVTA